MVIITCCIISFLHYFLKRHPPMINS